MTVSILRPKSFIGPERLGVFSLLYGWASEGRNFPVIGKGENRYQLLDVEDLCEAIFLCMTLDAEIVNDVFRITSYNVCYTKLLRFFRKRRVVRE